MHRFALICHRISGNFGTPSILLSVKEVLSKSFPGAEFTVFVGWSSYEQDLRYADAYGVEIYPLGNYWYLLWIGIIKRIFAISIGPRKYVRIVEKLQACDAVIDITGIIFEESLGRQTFRKCLYRGLIFPLCRILRVPFVKYTADIGPFKSKWNRFFGRHYMDKCMELIFARSETSKKSVEALGVRTPVRVLPDSAFIMRYDIASPAAAASRSGLRRPIIGISVSFQIYKRLKEGYIKALALFIDKVSEQYGASVILIPNDTCSLPINDIKVAEMVVESANSRDCLLMDNSQLSADEIKSVIANCDALLASRYHSVIAGLSAAVPTIVLGWHHKYTDVLSLFGLGELVLTAEEFSFEKLWGKFEHFWEERKSIRITLKEKLPVIVQSVYSGGEIMRKTLQANYYSERKID